MAGIWTTAVTVLSFDNGIVLFKNEITERESSTQERRQRRSKGHAGHAARDRGVRK